MRRLLLVPSDGGLASQLLWLGRALSKSGGSSEGLLFLHDTSLGARPFALAPFLGRHNYYELRGGDRLAQVAQRLAKFTSKFDSAPTAFSDLGVWQTLDFLRSSWPAALEGNFLKTQPILDDTVVAHVRLGDYLRSRHTFEHHGSLSEAWYRSCLERIRCLLPADDRMKVRIISDEPRIALKFMSRALAGLSVDLEIESAVDLFSQMKSAVSARYFVGSNSGISFWIAAAREEALEGATTASFLPMPWFRLQDREIQGWFTNGDFAPMHWLRSVHRVPSDFDVDWMAANERMTLEEA